MRSAMPLLCAVLVGLNGLYMLLVSFGNITDYGANEAFVHHVLSMDTTNFGVAPGTGLDPCVMWRAITDPKLQKIVYGALIAWETATALVLVGSVVLWVRERGTTYRLVRRISTYGLLMVVVLFMGGFITVGGEWFHNSVLALATLVLVHLPCRT